jgi:hypothetical protein
VPQLAIYLKFPISGMTTPLAIRSFIQAHDLSGMAVYPLSSMGDMAWQPCRCPQNFCLAPNEASFFDGAGSEAEDAPAGWKLVERLGVARGNSGSECREDLSGDRGAHLAFGKGDRSWSHYTTNSSPSVVSSTDSTSELEGSSETELDEN